MAPQFGTKHYPSHKATGTMASLCLVHYSDTWREGQKGWAQMYGADPTLSHWRRIEASGLGFPWRGQSLPIWVAPAPSPPSREGAELGGQECHEEEGDAHREGQVFSLGAGPADALLKLGHLGVLALKVFCG